MSLDMTLAIIQIILGLFLLYLGAEGLIRGSVNLAVRSGISRIVIGLTVVAFATSSPEMVVGIQTALQGAGNKTLGNMIGSNIANVGLILGIAALTRPLRINVKAIRLEIPLVLCSSLLLCLLLINKALYRLEGFLLSACFSAYTIYSIMLAKREKQRAVEREYAEAIAPPKGSLLRDLFFIMAGLAMLILGARYLIEGADAMARAFGISEAVIGLTLLALGTSLPELAAAVVASAKNEADIVVGNVLGSNLFNILLVLGVAALLQPIHAPEIKVPDLLALLLTAMLIIPIMRTKFTVNRREGGMLLLVYMLYMVHLVVR